MIRFIKKIDLPTIYKIEKENFQNPWINKQFKVQLKKMNAINIIIEQKNIIKGSKFPQYCILGAELLFYTLELELFAK